jgi:hypothetical protein
MIRDAANGLQNDVHVVVDTVHFLARYTEIRVSSLNTLPAILFGALEMGNWNDGRFGALPQYSILPKPNIPSPQFSIIPIARGAR